MDFEMIDPNVEASELNRGDIVSVVNDGRPEYLVIDGKGDEDEQGVLLYPARNLSTGDDDDSFIIDWNDMTAIYRSY